MVRLEFHDPSGALEVTQPHAARLASLEGKRIGFVSNEQWQAYRMLPMLKELLEQDFPGIEVLPAETSRKARRSSAPRRPRSSSDRAASTPSSSATPPEGPAPQQAAVQPRG